jgi:peroxiredoxin
MPNAPDVGAQAPEFTLPLVTAEGTASASALVGRPACYIFFNPG